MKLETVYYKDRHNRWIVERGNKIFLTGKKDVEDAIEFFFTKNPLSEGSSFTKLVVDQ